MQINNKQVTFDISNMVPRLLGQNCRFFLKFLLTLNSQKSLGYKRKTPNMSKIEVCPEGLGATLELIEYCYNEGGMVRLCFCVSSS